MIKNVKGKTKIIVYQPKDSPLRIVFIDEEIWHVAEDLCNHLDYEDPVETVRKYCKTAKVIKSSDITSYKSTLPIPNAGLTIIRTIDTYRLITYSSPSQIELIENMPSSPIKQQLIQQYVEAFKIIAGKEEFDPLFAQAIREFIENMEGEHL